MHQIRLPAAHSRARRHRPSASVATASQNNTVMADAIVMRWLHNKFPLRMRTCMGKSVMGEASNKDTTSESQSHID